MFAADQIDRTSPQDLADRHELSELVSRLGLWLDEHRWADARSVLTEDVVANTPGGAVVGIERVVDQAARNHTAVDRTQHVITNPLIGIDGNHASIVANAVVAFVTAEGDLAPAYEMGGRYRFTARRTPDGWRLSSIEARPIWSRGERPVPAAA